MARAHTLRKEIINHTMFGSVCATRSYLICNAITHTEQTNNLLTTSAHLISQLFGIGICCTLFVYSTLEPRTPSTYFIIKARHSSLVIQTVIWAGIVECNGTATSPRMENSETHILPISTYFVYAGFSLSSSRLTSCSPPLACHLLIFLFFQFQIPVSWNHIKHTHTKCVVMSRGSNDDKNNNKKWKWNEIKIKAFESDEELARPLAGLVFCSTALWFGAEMLSRTMCRATKGVRLTFRSVALTRRTNDRLKKQKGTS